MPLGLWVLQDRDKGLPLQEVGLVQSGQVADGGKNVQGLDHRAGRLAWFRNPFIRYDERGTKGFLEESVLSPDSVFAEVPAMVAPENDDGVVAQLQLVELGEYDEAVEVSDRLQGLKPGLPAYSRASYIRELYGDTPGAIDAMRLAADAGASGRPERAWALYQLGSLYLGDAKPDTAAFIYQGILEERPGFAPALAGLGHVALVRGDAAEAVRAGDLGLGPDDVVLVKGSQGARMERVSEGVLHPDLDPAAELPRQSPQWKAIP